LHNSEQWKVCSTCKRPIAFGASYYQCSVSTCNRSRTALFFCNVECWDAHLPMMRHREAWAETAHAPTREEWERSRAEEAAATTTKLEERTVNEAAGEKASEASSNTSGQSEAPRDVLVVVSKLKSYIKAKSGMNTSDGIIEVLSDHLRRIADQAIESAKSDGRKTVLDRDIRPLT
jgi:hypothetical protein